MTRSILLIVLYCLSVQAEPTAQLRRRVKAGEDADGGRIVNGTVAGSGVYPWFVLLDGGGCGGTLISKDRVLTSATCIINQNPSAVTVGASSSSDGTKVNVRCSNIHPDYYRSDDGLFNDVAVIKLQDSVDVATVNLNTDPTYPPFREQEFTTMGFGFTENNGPLSATLQVAGLQVLSPFDCQESFPEMGISSSQHVCAQSPAIGVCTGDSGGPLMDGAYSTSIQVGVVSFTFDGCASLDYPDVYAKVATYSGWIQAQIENDVCVNDVFSTAPSPSPTNAPITPAPAPAPTHPEKDDCFLSTFGDLLGGFLPFSSKEPAEGEDEPDYQGEGLEQEEEKNGGGFWDLFDKIVLGIDKDEENKQAQEDNKGGKDKDKNKGGKNDGANVKPQN